MPNPHITTAAHEWPIAPRDLPAALAPYQRPSVRRGLLEITVTIAPLLLLWAAALALVSHGQVWGLLLSVPAAAFLLRTFLIQHDCGHGAFFADKRANDWVGRIAGVLTLTPYHYWRHTHAVHHATTGNLDRRTLGAVDTLTVEEYRAMPAVRRLLYRLYRHPLVMFGLGPSLVFLIQQRAPIGLMRAGWRPWASTMGTNLAALALIWGAVRLAGAAPVLSVYLTSVLIAASAGVWMFYVQHQFEDTFWARHHGWDAREAALLGSSHYDLPQPLRWFTANIGVHHVHHVSSRIPFYRLPEVLRDHPHLRSVNRLTLWRSLACARLALWDEGRSRLVSFRGVRGERAAAAMGA